MKDFGMVRDQKEEVLVKSLYQLLAIKEGITIDIFKSALLIILHVDNVKNAKITLSNSEMHKKFATFYLNKISKPFAAKAVPRSPRTPKINANSKKLAEKYKARCKQQLNASKEESTTKEDLLVAMKSMQIQKVQTMRSRQAVEEFRRCTFHPTITTKGSNSKGKCQSPQNLLKTMKRTAEKTREEIEYERMKDELTFAPVINKYFIRIMIDLV